MAASTRGGKREGAGRKPGPGGKTVPIAVTIPGELFTQLEVARKQLGWTRSQAITEAVKKFLDSIRENQ